MRGRDAGTNKLRKIEKEEKEGIKSANVTAPEEGVLF
jgi:hypothetical protein